MPRNTYIRLNLVYRLPVYNFYSKILISDLCLKISSTFVFNKLKAWNCWNFNKLKASNWGWTLWLEEHEGRMRCFMSFTSKQSPQEPNVGLEPTNCEIMTWTEIKIQMLNWLSHPNTQKCPCPLEHGSETQANWITSLFRVNSLTIDFRDPAIIWFSLSLSLPLAYIHACIYTHAITLTVREGYKNK